MNLIRRCRKFIRKLTTDNYTIFIMSIVIALAILSFKVGHHLADNSFKQEAASRGFAEYYLDSKEIVRWRWKPL